MSDNPFAAAAIKKIKEKQPAQVIIQNKMRRIVERGNYDMVQLFSSEGLPLAGHQREQIVSPDRLAELSILLREVQKMVDLMGKISNMKEMVVEGFNQRKIIFRFFRAFNQEVVLAVVIPPRTSYRSVTNSLIRTIEKVSF